MRADDVALASICLTRADQRSAGICMSWLGASDGRTGSGHPGTRRSVKGTGETPDSDAARLRVFGRAGSRRH
jgi:hypothetical protein